MGVAMERALGYSYSNMPFGGGFLPAGCSHSQRRLGVAHARRVPGTKIFFAAISRVPTVPTRVAPAASAKGASGACAVKVRVAVDGPRGGALPG